MPRNAPADLPFDVLELIIEALGTADDKVTLRSFSLTAKEFVAKCQQQLFHTIDLGDRCIHGEEYYRRFLRIISFRPNFRHYIHEFRLVDTYVWDRSQNLKWLTTETSIASVLDLLPNLQAFSLCFNTGRLKWDNLRPPIRHALVKLAQRPTIKSYALSNIDAFPPSLLVSWCGIKHVELNRVDLEGSLGTSFDFVFPLSTIPNACITFLVLKSPTTNLVEYLSKILALCATPTLRSLVLTAVGTLDPFLPHALWTLIQWAAPTLIHFEWHSFNSSERRYIRPPEPIAISCLPSLQTLKTGVNFHSTEGVLFSEVLALLNQISSGHHFQTLFLQCMFLQVAELLACASDWAQLDEVLSKPEFSGLKAVVFCVRVRSFVATSDSIRTILMEQLPLSRAKGVHLSLSLESQ